MRDHYLCTLFWEYGRGRQNQATVRQGRFKLMRPGQDQPFELYDLAADPGELRNIAAKHPDVTTRLASAYQEWLVSVKRDASEPVAQQ